MMSDGGVGTTRLQVPPGEHRYRHGFSREMGNTVRLEALRAAQWNAKNNDRERSRTELGDGGGRC